MTTAGWIGTRWPLGIVAVIGASVIVFVASRNLVKDEVTNSTPKVPTVGVPEAKAVPVVAQDAPQAASEKSHPLDHLLVEGRKARDVLASIQDYTATFSKRERFGRRLVTTIMELKVRHEPFSVYLKFVEPKANAGREVIFVEGSNNDNLLVREVGFQKLLGTQSLQPTGSLAMADNRHPVTMIGMLKLLDKVIDQWESDQVYDDIVTRIESDAKPPGGVPCTLYESQVPTPRDKVQFHITRLWIDQQTHLPIRLEQLGFPQASDKTPPLFEEYTYSQVKTNVELTDLDFDVTNKQYHFRD